MSQGIRTETRGLSARDGAIQKGADTPSSGPGPVLMSETVHTATIYHQNGTASIAGNPSDLDLANITFTGPGGGGGDTFSGVTGGATSGTLAGGGYHGTYTNNYGGSVNFTNIERFNLHTGVHADNVITGDGDDTIASGDGNDTLQSGMGIDDVHGGLGDYDRWVADKSFTSTAIVLDLTSIDPQTYLGTGDVTGIESLYLKTGSGHDVITGLVAANSSNSIDGGGGDDAIGLGIYGQVGAATVNGGAGDDLMRFTFTGGGAGGGDTFNAVSGGVSSGSVATGYSGQFTNGYGATADFLGVERFDITTGAHADNIKTGDGNDSLSGRDANDTLDSGKGVDVIDGGAGAYDRWVADKSFATEAIVVDFTSAGAQAYLTGGSVTGIESLFVKTGSGNDVLTGHVLSGNANEVSLGAGDDAVILGAYGQYGANTVVGGTGDDLLTFTFTGAGAGDTFNAISGGVSSGNAANGHAGVFTNGYGSDLTFSQIERFNLTTGLHADNVATGDRGDTVTTGLGNDTLDTGKGIDVVDGGGGDRDRWIADKSAATAAIVIDFTSLTAQTYLGTGSVLGVESVFLKTGSGNDVLTGHVLSSNANRIESGGGSDQITLGNYHQVGDNTVNGGGGNDLLVFTWTGGGGGGGDTFNGVTSGALSGDATTGHAGQMNNGYGGNLTFSGIERFNISTGVHADSIKTGDGADTVSGNDGNDVLDTGKGVDVVNGGAGADRWIADKSGTNAKLKLDITLAGPQAYLTTGSVESVESLFLKSGGGNDEITAWVSGNDNSITAGAGDDRITLGNYHQLGINTVHGGDGHDRLNHTWTGAGGDTFSGVSGGITSGNITNGYSGQLINGYGGTLTFTGIEELNLTTGVHADNITTGNGHDTVNTNGGNDVISTGRGVDVVDGGAGNDYWTSDKSFAEIDIDIDLTSAAPQSYLIVGAVQGIEGINITTGSGDDRIVCTQSQNSDYVSTRAGSDKITLAGFHQSGADTADGGLGKDRLSVVHLGDTFSGLIGGVTGGDFDGGYSGFITNGYGGSYTFSNIEHFSLFTGDHADNLTTGGGRDLIESGGGHDTLVAGDNADTLVGGLGIDGMTGGLGADVFRYEAVAESSNSSGRDVIADFAPGDRIDLAAIDAKSGTPADNKFDFIGTTAFSNKAGELRYSQGAGNTHLEADVNGDGVADWAVQVNGLYAFAETDFVL